jgi:hypothetical protein
MKVKLMTYQYIVFCRTIYVATYLCMPLGFGTVWFGVLATAGHTLLVGDFLRATSVSVILSNTTTFLIDNDLYSWI